MPNTLIALTPVWMDDPDADTSYLEQEEFADRLAEYRRGDFGFLGCRARAEVVVNGVVQTITSGGLWGIESDSDDDYRREVELGELSELIGILREMCVPEEEIEAARQAEAF